MDNKENYEDITRLSGNTSIKIIKSGLLSKRSKYLKIWKK